VPVGLRVRLDARYRLSLIPTGAGETKLSSLAQETEILSIAGNLKW